MKVDKVTQHTKVLIVFNRNSRSGRHWRKEEALTRGDLSFHELKQEKSADAVLVKETSHHEKMEDSQK
jgi:hypothetical protein